MPITSMDRYFVGNPNIVGVVTTDNYIEITAPYYFLLQAPYVQLIQNGDFEFSETDIILIFYAGGIGFFTYNALTQTFVPGANGGEVILPVTPGDFAVFANPAGAIADQGYFPSNPALTNVGMVDLTGGVTINNFASFEDTSGTIHDNKYSPSDPLLGNVAMAVTTITPVIGNIVEFADTSGSIVDSGTAVSSLIELKLPPAIANYMAKFYDTTGDITAAPSVAINAGAIQAGLSGTRGFFTSYPDTAGDGYFAFSAVNNLGDYPVTLSNAPFGQRCNVTIPDPINANGQLLIAATTTPFIDGNIPQAVGTTGLMVDSGIQATDLVTLTSAPSTAGYMAKFSNTTGGVSDAAGVVYNDGAIVSGRSGYGGLFIAYSSTPTSGKFQYAAGANSGDYTVTLLNDSFGQSGQMYIADPGSSVGRVLVANTSTPFINGNLPVAVGGVGVMADSSIAAADVVVKGYAPKLYASQLAATTQSIPAGVYTQVTLDSVAFDTYSAFAANAYTVPIAGYYYISMQINITLVGGDVNVLPTASIYVNGVDSQVLASTGYVTNDLSYGVIDISGLISLNLADVVTLRVYQNTGGARLINSGSAIGNTFLSLALFA